MDRLSLTELHALYVRERAPLLNYLARRTADPEIALELLAETFAHAVASRDRFRAGADDQAVRWLYGIARNKLADFYRRGRCERRALRRLGIQLDRPSEELLAEVSRSAHRDRRRRHPHDRNAASSEFSRPDHPVAASVDWSMT